MRLRDKESMVPDHQRRALRLAVAVLVLASTGFSLIGRQGSEGWVMLAKWAALTAPVVTMPLLGKTSQVGFERILGTVVGGTLGYLATALATHWWTLQATETDDLFLAVCAAAGAAASVLAGQRLGLDLSARLFVIAFLLVAFSSQQGGDPITVALTRVGGIAGGVLTMMLLSVLILPKSATVESLRSLRKALAKLREVNATAWGSHLAPTQQRQQWQAAAAAAANGTAEAGTNAGGSPVKSPGAGISKGPAKAALADSAELLQPLLAPADGGDGGDLESGHSAAAEAAAAEAAAEAAAAAEEAAEDAALRKSETALTQLYQLLEKVAEQLDLARNEVWLGNWHGRPVLLPGLWPRRQAAHLPWKELEGMANAIRRVARLLNSLLTSLQGGFDRQLREVLGPLYPDTLLPSLAAGADAAIQELHAAFPCERAASAGGLAAFAASVLGLVDLSDQQRRQVSRALRRDRSRSSARASWSLLIDAVLQQQQVARAAPAAEQEAASEPAGAAAGAGVRQALREPSLAAWLGRVSSATQSSGASGAISEAVADAAAAAGPGGEAGRWRGRPSPVKSASMAASLPRGLSAALEQPGGDAAVPAAEAQADPASPARPSSAAGGPEAPGAPALQLSRLMAMRGDSGSVPVVLFPDSLEGRLAQVSWYTFQGVCEELAEQLAGLHAAVGAVLARLPE